MYNLLFYNYDIFLKLKNSNTEEKNDVILIN